MKTPWASMAGITADPGWRSYGQTARPHFHPRRSQLFTLCRSTNQAGAYHVVAHTYKHPSSYTRSSNSSIQITRFGLNTEIIDLPAIDGGIRQRLFPLSFKRPGFFSNMPFYLTCRLGNCIRNIRLILTEKYSTELLKCLPLSMTKFLRAIIQSGDQAVRNVCPLRTPQSAHLNPIYTFYNGPQIRDVAATQTWKLLQFLLMRFLKIRVNHPGQTVSPEFA